MNATDLQYLQGKSVRVTSARDLRNPPAGRRGTIQVTDEGSVILVLDFPQMFRTPAHRTTIPLTPEQVSRLLASEDNGAFSFVVDDELI